MKKFIIRILIFSIPVVIINLEIFFPINLFTYRVWEALIYNHNGRAMPFYPNQNIQMISEGDLCYYSTNAVKKNERWHTDVLGYRNDSVIENPDILLIGDSFLAGSSLTQDSTLTNLLLKKSANKLTYYNLSPASFSDFIFLYENKLIKKPKLLILSLVERSLPFPIEINSKEIINKYTIFSFWKDKVTRLYSIKYLKSRITNKTGSGIQSPINHKMFFLNGINNEHNDEDLITTSNIIISYKKYCDSLGIDFLFLPMPDKETVYFELVPFVQQPNYLFRLDSILSNSNVATVNTLKIYNEFRKENNSLLYHYDDTHWNSNATEILSYEIIKMQNVRTHSKGYMQ